MLSLSRKKAYRVSMFRNLATSLVLYEKVTTTKAKAKEVKAIVEHLIVQAKKNDLAARRRLLSYFFDDKATDKMLEELLPRYKNVNSGMIKSYHLCRRLGDNAEQVLLELDKGKVILEPEGKNGKENAEKSNDKLATTRSGIEKTSATKKTSPTSKKRS